MFDQSKSESRKRALKHRKRGFSLVEAMIASAVLGIGLVGLVRVHTSTVQGVMRGNQQVTAMRIADQRAELLATQRPDLLLLPTCPASLDTLGCKLTPRTFAANKTCTSWVDGPDVPTPAGASAALVSQFTGYRLDVVVGDHPDALNQSGGFLATVSVCWQDEQGFIRQVQSRRLLVPGT